VSFKFHPDTFVSQYDFERLPFPLLPASCTFPSYPPVTLYGSFGAPLACRSPIFFFPSLGTFPTSPRPPILATYFRIRRRNERRSNEPSIPSLPCTDIVMVKSPSRCGPRPFVALRFYTLPASFFPSVLFFFLVRCLRSLRCAAFPVTPSIFLAVFLPLLILDRPPPSSFLVLRKQFRPFFPLFDGPFPCRCPHSSFLRADVVSPVLDPDDNKRLIDPPIQRPKTAAQTLQTGYSQVHAIRSNQPEIPGR